MAEHPIRYIIVDDEPIAHRIIEDYCAALPHLELAKNCYDALEALAFLQEQSVDLIFLDINMPKLKGFDFLRTLVNPPQVIVTTAYAEFALEGFELSVCDYVLKPFALPRFLTAVNKALSNHSGLSSSPISSPELSSPLASETSTNSSASKPESIFIKGDKKHHQVMLKDITHIEACGNYCLVFTKESKIMTHEKISTFEAQLPDEDFLRVHKSFIVAKGHVVTISGSHVQIREISIPIGQTYKPKVMQLLSASL